jgi:hypothetical protein
MQREKLSMHVFNSISSSFTLNGSIESLIILEFENDIISTTLLHGIKKNPGMRSLTLGLYGNQRQ